jgi:diphthine-ammonia ligase
MRIVGLVSGGKDSCYNLLECVAAGHEVVALAHLISANKGML